MRNLLRLRLTGKKGCCSVWARDSESIVSCYFLESDYLQRCLCDVLQPLRLLCRFQGLQLLVRLNIHIDLGSNKNDGSSPIKPDHKCNWRGQNSINSVELELPEVLKIEAQAPCK